MWYDDRTQSSQHVCSMSSHSGRCGLHGKPHLLPRLPNRLILLKGFRNNPQSTFAEAVKGAMQSHTHTTRIKFSKPSIFCKRAFKFSYRYLQPPSGWVSCSLESRELLGLCLKKLKGLNKVRLVDASFIWTEPHSKRLKVKLTVQKEVGVA